MDDSEGYISNRDTLSRLVRLETKVCLKFEELEKALVLARETVSAEMNKATSALNSRLEGMNEFRRQMDKQEGTYAKKEAVDRELDSIKRLLYIGVGLMLAVGIILRFVKL